MTFHQEAWQYVLEFVIVVATLTGLTLIVRSYVEGPRRLGDRERSRMRLAGGVATLVGAAAWFLTSELRAPIRRPGPPPSVPPADSVTEGSFASAALPAVKLVAPPGWRVSFDAGTRKLEVLEDAGAVVAIFTRRLEPGSSPSGVRAELKKQLGASGVVPVEVDDTIAGRAAMGIVALSADGAIASWAIDRGGSLVTVVQCKTGKDRDARTGCKAVLDRLEWVTPR